MFCFSIPANYIHYYYAIDEARVAAAVFITRVNYMQWRLQPSSFIFSFVSHHRPAFNRFYAPILFCGQLIQFVEAHKLFRVINLFQIAFASTTAFSHSIAKSFRRLTKIFVSSLKTFCHSLDDFQIIIVFVVKINLFNK